MYQTMEPENTLNKTDKAEKEINPQLLLETLTLFSQQLIKLLDKK